MRFQNSMFSRFYMKIEKALELFYFRNILKFFGMDLFILTFKRAPRWVFIKIVFSLKIIRDFRNFSGEFVWKIQSIAKFSGIRLETLKKLFNYDQNTKPFVIFMNHEFCDTLNFPYKIAVKILKIANYFQTKNKFDENSTWSSFKCQNTQIQGKKFEYFSKIKKF